MIYQQQITTEGGTAILNKETTEHVKTIRDGSTQRNMKRHDEIRFGKTPGNTVK